MSFHTCRMYILPDTLNLDTLLVDLDQPKIRPKRPERPSGTAPVPYHLLMPLPCASLDSLWLCRVFLSACIMPDRLR